MSPLPHLSQPCFVVVAVSDVAPASLLVSHPMLINERSCRTTTRQSNPSYREKQPGGPFTYMNRPKRSLLSCWCTKWTPAAALLCRPGFCLPWSRVSNCRPLICPYPLPQRIYSRGALDSGVLGGFCPPWTAASKRLSQWPGRQGTGTS